MPRPINCRRIGCLPQVNYYKPQGIPLSVLQCTILTVDELEAIRLADLQGLYQEQAAEKMNISRQTFGRIIESAHKKIADALVNGKALSIQGGSVKLSVPPEAIGSPPHRFRRGRHGRGHCRGRGQ
ncbi:MAG: DUF134 domain-containing protein [Phycisphaerae bacterium]|nr:DUF134 domain-containing protein [Phycisphaerae bacterium]